MRWKGTIVVLKRSTVLASNAPLPYLYTTIDLDLYSSTVRRHVVRAKKEGKGNEPRRLAKKQETDTTSTCTRTGGVDTVPYW
jgi:hypothetical protein